MRVRALSPTGDYQFGSGSLNYLINLPETVAQVVETTLRLFQGEWYLDVTAGTPYFEGVIGKYSQDEADATLISTITNVQGVINIVNFKSEINPSTRQYKVTSGTVNTIYGPTELDLENEQIF